MSRIILSLMCGAMFGAAQLIVLQMILAEKAFCRPPDEVVNSPIPPIEAPAQRKPNVGAARELDSPAMRALNSSAPRAINSPALRGLASEGINLGPQRQASGSAQPSGLQKPPAAEGRNNAAPIEAPPTQYYETARSPEELWNSTPMQVARKGVIEFSRHSAQTSPAEGEQFLSRLAKSSVKDMASWLERYQVRQADLSIGRNVQKMARQLMLDEAISQQEATRRAYENVSRMRDEAAAAQEQNAFERAQTTQAIRDRQSEQQQRIIGLGPIYNPLEPVLDPMSPQGYRRRVAAAMSLPGDLPASDPRNFIRGEEGIDTGDAANAGGAEPSAPAAPATPAPAAPVGPAPAGE